MIPRLETERLLLREWRVEDFDPFAQIVADAEVMRFLGGVPLTRAEAWRSLAGFVGHWTLRGYGLWAVERKIDGALIGRVGLINPEGWPGMEVGWTLGRSYWGQGYAVEAARASLDYGFLTQPVASLISLIDPDNIASQNVARRLGQSRGERIDLVVAGKTYVDDVWSISREAWMRRRAA